MTCTLSGRVTSSRKLPHTGCSSSSSAAGASRSKSYRRAGFCPTACPNARVSRTVPSVPKGAKYPISVRLPVPPCCDLVFLHFIQLSVYREQGVIVQCRERFELFCADGLRHPAALPVLPFCHISFKFSVLPVLPKGNCGIKQKRQLSKAVFLVVRIRGLEPPPSCPD